MGRGESRPVAFDDSTSEDACSFDEGLTVRSAMHCTVGDADFSGKGSNLARSGGGGSDT